MSVALTGVKLSTGFWGPSPATMFIGSAPRDCKGMGGTKTVTVKVSKRPWSWVVTMKGTVKEWVWKNPHCFVVYEVKEADGKVVEWTAETSSTSSMVGEFGWSRTTLKAGDELIISVLPSRAGSLAGLLYKIVAADGKVLIEDKTRLRDQ